MTGSYSRTVGASYGWVLVALCFVVLGVASGGRFAFGVIFDPLLREFDASRTAISLTSSVRLAAYAVSQPIFGWLFDRYDDAPVFAASIALVAAGLAGSAFVTSLFGIYLTLGAMVGFGIGGVSALAIAAILSSWFDERRNFAVGLANSGFNVGQLAIVPLVGVALTTVDWQFSMLTLGVVLLALVGPAYLLVGSPADDGDGADERSSSSVGGQLGVSTLGESIRTRSFGGMVVGYFFCGFTDFMIAVHLVSYLTEKGVTLSVAAGALGLMGGASLVGVVVSGWASDRMKTKNLLAAMYASRVVALLLLTQVAALGGYELAAVYVFIGLFGGSFYATAPLTSTLAVDLYGDSLMGSVYGWVSGLHQAGAAIGAAFAGAIFDLTGSYVPAFYVGAGSVLIGALATYLIRERAGPDRASAE